MILPLYFCTYIQNRTNSLPRRGDPSALPTASSSNPRARDFSLTRMSSLNNGQYGGPTSSTSSPAAGVALGGGGGHWTDSLPRRDFYSNIAPTGSLPRRDKAGLGRPEPPRPPQNFNNGGLNTRRRDGSLNRENTSTFKDAFMAGNKGINRKIWHCTYF